MIIKTFHFRSWYASYCCEIFTDFYEVNVQIYILNWLSNFKMNMKFRFT